MPEWVTALEAAVLTGASEIVVLDAVRSGRLRANPLSMGKGSSGVLMVRLRDVQALVEEVSRPAAPAAPTVEATPAAAPGHEQALGAAEWLDGSEVWNELTDTATPPPVAASPAPTVPTTAPSVPPVPTSAPAIARPPATAPAPSAFAPFSTPITPAPAVSPPATSPPVTSPPLPASASPVTAPPASAPVAPVPSTAAPVVDAPPVAPAPVAPPVSAPPAAPPAPVAPAPVSPVVPTAPPPAAKPAPSIPAATPAPDTARRPSTAPTGIWGERKAPPQPAPEIPVAAKAERPRLRNPKTLFAAILALALLAAAVYVARPGAGGNNHPRVAGSLGAAPPSVVWMIPTPQGNQIAVVGLPKSGPAVAIALPSEAHVILPAGDISTVATSADSGPHAQAVAQNVLLKRIGHYLVTTPTNFGKLVDALGGIQVQTEAPFTFKGHRIDPGSIQMGGAMAVAYLAQASTDDVTGRWEDLLAGVLDAAHESSAWGTIGESDDPVVVSRLLAASTGATVLEMPTGPASGGGIEVDRDALSAMLPRFGQSLGSLVRVVVVNGSGAPGLGTLIDGRLASDGFSVVTSENASHFNVTHSTVVASGQGNLRAAEVAAKILGVKSVKISDQPTRLADVTIIVGKDLHT